LSNEEKEKLIEDCVERETAGATNSVEDTEVAVQKEQRNIKHMKIVGLTNKEP
jgi:hypothetical protein